MDDEDIAVFIPTGDDSHMGVIRVKYEIARKCVCSGDCCAVGMLAGCAAAMTDDVVAFRGVVERPIDEAAAIQTVWAVGSGAGTAVRRDLLHRTPAAVPTQHQRLATPKVIDLADKRTGRLDDFTALR